MIRHHLVTGFIVLGSLLVASAGVSQVIKVEAAATAFRLTLSDGSVKEGVDLSGTVLVFDLNGTKERIRIASVAPDPHDKSGLVLLHDFRLAATDAPLCQPDPDGQHVGFPLAGRIAPDGSLIDEASQTFQLICAASAQGKCVRLGYRPWEQAADGTPMRDYYNACVRMIRADYCGDGQVWTHDGTLIDLWDRLGLQPADREESMFSFEAGWKPDGAVCVARTRLPKSITLDRLKVICPKLSNLPTCDESTAKAAGALLFNASR